MVFLLKSDCKSLSRFAINKIIKPELSKNHNKYYNIIIEVAIYCLASFFAKEFYEIVKDNYLFDISCNTISILILVNHFVFHRNVVNS